MDRASHMEIVFGDICGPMGKVDHPLCLGDLFLSLLFSCTFIKPWEVESLYHVTGAVGHHPDNVSL